MSAATRPDEDVVEALRDADRELVKGDREAARTSARMALSMLTLVAENGGEEAVLASLAEADPEILRLTLAEAGRLLTEPSPRFAECPDCGEGVGGHCLECSWGCPE